MSDKITVVITANGEGSRMKAISPTPKHLLYYGGKRIINCILDEVKPIGQVFVFSRHPEHLPAENWLECGETESRMDQLNKIRHWKNVLIVDCDVIPVFKTPTFVPDFKGYFEWLPTQPNDFIFCFSSDSAKYGGLHFDFKGDGLGYLESAIECEVSDSRILRASGVYFLKDVGKTVAKMTDPNSIASGMIGAKGTPEQTFIRVGDPEDYLNALGK